MARTPVRQTIRWDRAAIDRFIAEGKAQYFPGLPGYVIKDEGKSFAVRDFQIDEGDVFANAPKTVVHVPSLLEETARDNKLASLVEEYFTALHGPAENRDGEFWEEERNLYERLTNSEDGELEHSIREEIFALRQKKAQDSLGVPLPGSQAEDDLLAKFGV